MKKEALLEQVEAQGWKACMLSDLCFPENGFVEYRTDSQKWLLVHHGKVGILLNEEWAARWRAGGAYQYFTGQANKRPSRAMALHIPGAKKGRTTPRASQKGTGKPKERRTPQTPRPKPHPKPRP